jgi:hypothetical protein
MQLGERRRIDLVGLDLGMGNHPHLERIGDRHPPHEGAQQAHDHGRVDRRLDHHLVVRTKRPAKGDHRITREIDPPSTAQLPILKDRHHREAAVYVQPDHPHVASRMLAFAFGSVWATRHLRIRARSAPGLVAGAAR